MICTYSPKRLSIHFSLPEFLLIFFHSLISHNFFLFQRRLFLLIKISLFFSAKFFSLLFSGISGDLFLLKDLLYKSNQQINTIWCLLDPFWFCRRKNKHKNKLKNRNLFFVFRCFFGWIFKFFYFFLNFQVLLICRVNPLYWSSWFLLSVISFKLILKNSV